MLDHLPKDLVDRVAPQLVKHLERVASHPTELRDSIVAVDSPEEIDAALRDEIVRRVQCIESGEAALLDGDEVYRRLRVKYER